MHASLLEDPIDVIVKYSEITPEDASSRLERLVRWYEIGLQRPLKFKLSLLKRGGYTGFLERISNRKSFSLYEPIAYNKGFFTKNVVELLDEQELIASVLFDKDGALLLKNDSFG